MLLTFAIIVAASLGFLLGIVRGRLGMEAAIKRACIVTRDATFEEIVTIAIQANERYHAQLRAGVAEGLQIGLQLRSDEAQ